MDRVLVLVKIISVFLDQLCAFYVECQAEFWEADTIMLTIHAWNLLILFLVLALADAQYVPMGHSSEDQGIIVVAMYSCLGNLARVLACLVWPGKGYWEAHDPSDS